MKKNDVPGLCIVSPYCYPLFNPQCRSPFGGAEVRVSAIARGLAERGNFRVSMVVWDHQQPDIEIIDGVKLYAWQGKEPPLKPLEQSDDGEPESEPAESMSVQQEVAPDQSNVLRTVWKKFMPRWLRALFWNLYESPKRLYQFLRDHPRIHYHPVFVAGFIGPHDVRRKDIAIYQKVNADYYLMAGNSKEAAELAFYCKSKGKPYVFLTAHDADYDAGYLEKPDEVGVWGYGYLMNYSVQNASLHITQNEYQQKILQERYRRSSIVIRNPIDLAKRVDVLRNQKNILWVGKSEWFKQPEVILDLAEQFPEYDFTMILAHVDPALHGLLIKRAKSLSHVEVMSYVPFNEVETYFARARLLVNTSVFEGFPNTFLQAAKYNVPVVSLQVDAGEMLSVHDCGFVCGGDFEQLKNRVQVLMMDDAVYHQKSSHCQEYLQKYHDRDKIIAAYEKALLSLTT